MEDNLDYIDSYFKGDRLPEETRQFGERVISDPVFAEDVAFYLSAMQVAKEQAAEQKKARFKEIHNHKEDSETGSIFKVRPVRKLWPYIAAAAIITAFIIGRYVFQSSDSLQQLADNYVSQHFGVLPVTMGNSEDSMQKGLRLFNEGKLTEALIQFENIAQTDTSSFTAKKNAGIVSLRMQQYDKALSYFKQLESYTGLYSNPGLFFQALTLLRRNLPGDEQKARQLLGQVVQNDLEGKEPAQEWLKKK